MEKIDAQIYARIDNNVYKTQGDIWWKPDSVLHLIKTSLNPWRLEYADIIFKRLGFDAKGKTPLEVGRGGGILSEEIARMGFVATGIEPALESIVTATNHAKVSGLNIKYDQGTGENLPYANASFDWVFCCDVLEHVQDLPKVISEISRVLKAGGVFFYDTLNRTFISKLVAIKIWQEWKRWAFMPQNLHAWEMFIKPKELTDLLQKNGLEWKEHRGSSPNVSIPKMLGYLRKRVKGEWTFKEPGENFKLLKSNDMSILYAGYSIKK